MEQVEVRVRRVRRPHDVEVHQAMELDRGLIEFVFLFQVNEQLVPNGRIAAVHRGPAIHTTARRRSFLSRLPLRRAHVFIQV